MSYTSKSAQAANPIHDQFCRKRCCKPSLAGSPQVEYVHAGWGVALAFALLTVLVIVAHL